MLFARMGVVVLLSAGLVFFGVFVVNDLAKGLKGGQPQPPPETLALGTANDPQLGGDFTQAQTADEALGPQFIPIAHDPGRLPAYPGARREVCHQLAEGERFGDERAHYIVSDTDVAQVIRHYANAATQAGFTLQDVSPMQGQPDSRKALLVRGQETLIIAVAPRLAAPPMAPTLSVAVQFRYPIAAQR